MILRFWKVYIGFAANDDGVSVSSTARLWPDFSFEIAQFSKVNDLEKARYTTYIRYLHQARTIEHGDERVIEI